MYFLLKIHVPSPYRFKKSPRTKILSMIEYYQNNCPTKWHAIIALGVENFGLKIFCGHFGFDLSKINHKVTGNMYDLANNLLSSRLPDARSLLTVE